jgi:hypothetical protein
VVLRSVLQLLVTANAVPSSLILSALMMEAIRRFLQEPRDVTFPKTAFFIVTAVKTSNLSLFMWSTPPLQSRMWVRGPGDKQQLDLGKVLFDKQY